MTDPEPLTPEDTTIVMIDYAVDFANLLRSHDLGTPINNVVGLAERAVRGGRYGTAAEAERAAPERGRRLLPGK